MTSYYSLLAKAWTPIHEILILMASIMRCVGLATGKPLVQSLLLNHQCVIRIHDQTLVRPRNGDRLVNVMKNIKPHKNKHRTAKNAGADSILSTLEYILRESVKPDSAQRQNGHSMSSIGTGYDSETQYARDLRMIQQALGNIVIHILVNYQDRIFNDLITNPFESNERDIETGPLSPDDDYSNECKTISSREKEVIAQACGGKTNREISEILCISEKTVKNHLWKIYQKLGVKNRTQMLHKIYYERISMFQS